MLTDLPISMSATSAADCSAAFRLKNPGSDSYLALLMSTVDLKIGSWDGPSLRVWYSGVIRPAFCAYSCSLLLKT
jgi:hypothetical protein